MNNITQKWFEFGDKKSASISQCHNVRYIHLQDKMRTHKRISFSPTEYFELLGKQSMIAEAFAQLNKKIKRQDGG